MRTAFHALAAAALFGAVFTLAGPAGAQSRPAETTTQAGQQAYPRTYGSGENIMVDYGPGGQAALVGGGRVVVTQPNGMDVNIVHLDAMFVQQPREGFVPLTVGSGESTDTVWVPQSMVEQFRRARGTYVVR